MLFAGFVHPKTGKQAGYRVAILILLFISLACGSNLPFSASPTPTPTEPKLVQVDVEVIYPSPTATATPPPNTPSDSVPPPPTDTPPPSPTPTPTSTPIPPIPIPTNTAPPPPPTPTPEVIGEIILLEPESDILLPVKVRDYEFKWRWTGRAGCQLPSEYAFEVRIWPPGLETPLGAMDAIHHRPDVYCDPVSGLYSYTVPNLKDTPGAMAVAVETAGTGPFLWNVALMRTYPAIVPLATAPPRFFTIPGDYVGPYDTSRPTVTCLDFSVWLEAQALYLATGGPRVDLNNLDPDGNGIACDELRK